MFKLLVTLIQLLVNESKLLRMVLLRLGISFLLLGAAWAFMVIGLGFIVWALYLYLTNYLNPPIAALASGFLLLLVTGILVWIAISGKRLRIFAPGNLTCVRQTPAAVTLVVLLAG